MGAEHNDPPPPEAVRRTRILVVEDEESYREVLATGLAKEGYEVELAADGATGLRRFAERLPDLVLLDVLLPAVSGTEVCRQMRALAPEVPVIMVSALDAEVDVVLGLELGAADYITKPYHLRELVARVQALLRRVAPPPYLARPEAAASPVLSAAKRAARRRSDELVQAGPLEVDFAKREVRVRGNPVHLSRQEFDLLALVLTPPGRVRTRDELIEQLWSGRDLADSRTLDTHVRRLRLKIELDPSAPEFLVTVRGVGFRFDPEGQGSKR